MVVDVLLAGFCEGTSPDLQLQSGILWEGCVGMNEANPVLSLFWVLQDSLRGKALTCVSLCLATCLQAKGLTDLQLQWVFPFLQLLYQLCSDWPSCYYRENKTCPRFHLSSTTVKKGQTSLDKHSCDMCCLGRNGPRKFALGCFSLPEIYCVLSRRRMELAV